MPVIQLPQKNSRNFRTQTLWFLLCCAMIIVAPTMIQAQSIPVMKGINAQTITTKRLTTRVLFSGKENAEPVLFLHGNFSSATWWEETMLALPEKFRGIAPDLRGFGASDTAALINATRGAGDWADDVVALMETLGLARVHIVGNSLGGYIVWRLMAEYPEKLLSVTLIAPGSPFGFGGTKDINGTPCASDFAGTGAGLSNPLLLKAIKDGDRSAATFFTPRFALRNAIVKPPLILKREEEILSSMMSIHLDERTMPGDKVTSPHWPMFAPGKWGIINALSPQYAGDVSKIWKQERKVPVLWIRGSHDVAVSNSAAADIATLGMRGLVPGYPGKDKFPPQPMLDQTRDVLKRYQAAGGTFQEIIIENSAHVPYLEQPAEFQRIFFQFLNKY